MKKHLIAAAVAAAVAVPAAAQVSIYGIMDIGYTDSSNRESGGANQRDTTSTGNGDGGLSTSRLGFRGTEDLGGGLKAGFNLEYDLVDVGNGGNTFGARVSTVSLENAMGKLTLGRDASAIHGIMAGFSAGFANNVTGALYSAGGPDSANENSVRPHSVFTNDMISYQLPKIMGVAARLDYAKFENETNGTIATENKEVGMSLRYTAGPLDIGLGYQDRSQEAAGITAANLALSTAAIADRAYEDAVNGFFGMNRNFLNNLRIGAGTALGAGNAGAANTRYKAEQDTTAFGVSYNFGVAQPFLLHTKVDAGLGVGAAPAVGDLFEATATEFGVRIPMGTTTLFGSVMNGDIEMRNSATQVAAGEADISAWQVGATYAMSKRTTAYAIYGVQETENDARTARNASINSESKAMSIGVRHSF